MAGEGEGGLTGVLGPCQRWDSVLRREQGPGEGQEEVVLGFTFSTISLMALQKRLVID